MVGECEFINDDDDPWMEALWRERGTDAPRAVAQEHFEEVLTLTSWRVTGCGGGTIVETATFRVTSPSLRLLAFYSFCQLLNHQCLIPDTKAAGLLLELRQ